MSKLDYYNLILTGPHADLNIECSPESQNTAVRLICQLRPRDHVGSSLQQLHGCPYGDVFCTNSAYWCTKSTVVKLQNTSATLTTRSLQRHHDLVCDLETIRITVYLSFGLSFENEPFCMLDQQHGTVSTWHSCIDLFQRLQKDTLKYWSFQSLTL